MAGEEVKSKEIISPWLQLTNRCNLQCSYCFIKQNSMDMSKETFNRINKYYSSLLDNNEVNKIQYRIAGGEPCLVIEKYFSLIEEMIIKYKERFHIELITNGSLFNANILNFIKKYNTNFGLCLFLDSINKDSKTNDKSSISSLVLSNIKKLQKNKITVSISTVIIENGKQLSVIGNFVMKEGFYWDVNLNKYYEEYNLREIKHNIDLLFKVIKSYDYPITKIQFNGIDMRKNTGCEAGGKLCAINVDGKRFNCQTLFSQSKIYRYNKSECKDCDILDFCGGGCKYNNIENRKKFFCKIQRYYFKKGGQYALSL